MTRSAGSFPQATRVNHECKWPCQRQIRSLPLGLLLATASCADAPRATMTPSLDCWPLFATAVDTTLLAETDSVYIADPAATFLANGDGSVIVPDAGRNRLMVFARSGQFLLIADSLIIQSDYKAVRLQVFRVGSGEWLGSIAYEGYLSWLALAEGRLTVSILDEQRGKSVDIVSLAAFRNTLRDGGPAISGRLLAVPAEYRRYPRLQEYADVKAIAISDTLVAAFGGLPDVVRTIFTTERADTFLVPTCGRRGTPAGALESLFRSRPRNAKEDLALTVRTTSSLSALLGLWRMSTGAFLIWYQDAVLESNGQLLKGTAFLSIIQPDLTKACVDARIEAAGSGRPRIAMVGDTVLVLDRIQSGAPPRVRTVIRRYTLDSSTCSWLATRS